jgi:hypothetical protein
VFPPSVAAGSHENGVPSQINLFKICQMPANLKPDTNRFRYTNRFRQIDVNVAYAVVRMPISKLLLMRERPEVETFSKLVKVSTHTEHVQVAEKSERKC